MIDRLLIHIKRIRFRRAHPHGEPVGAVPLSTHLTFLGIFAVLLISAISVMTISFADTPLVVEKPAELPPEAPKPPENPAQIKAAQAQFTGVSLTGESAIVVDLSSGEVLFQKEPDAVRPLASITKLMTALVAAERLPRDGAIAITPDDLAPEGESMFVIGDEWKIPELLSFTLLTSSNDGARALAASAGAVINLAATETTSPDDNVESFINAMNAKAGLLGMSRSIFRSETGLDISSNESGASGSARDVATLLGYILKTHPSLLDVTAEDAHTFKSEGGTAYPAHNTNKVAREIPGLWASKTGYTDLAGGNLAVIINVDLNRPVAIVVLGSTAEGRFRDIQQLAGATRAYFGTRYP